MKRDCAHVTQSEVSLWAALPDEIVHQILITVTGEYTWNAYPVLARLRRVCRATNRVVTGCIYGTVPRLYLMPPGFFEHNLYHFTALRHLSLDGKFVPGFDGCSETQWREWNRKTIHRERVMDLRSLNRMPNLSSLHYARVTASDGLETLTQLRKLSIGATPSGFIWSSGGDTFRGIPSGLTSLAVMVPTLGGLEPVTNLPHLRRLKIHGTQWDRPGEQNSLISLTQLRRLVLNNTTISLPPMTWITRLTLNIHGRGSWSQAPRNLGSLRGLTRLDHMGALVSSTTLVHLTNLVSLDGRQVKIADNYLTIYKDDGSIRETCVLV